MAKATSANQKGFSAARKWLRDLDADVASALITAASDVALVIDADDEGLIRDVAFGSDELERDFGGATLLGKRWSDLVTTESQPKIDALLADAQSATPGRWRHVNHVIDGRDSLPILFTAMQVGERGRVLAVGRSMRSLATMQQRVIEAQRSMEREYSRLRQAETRHRLLFQLASEAVIIVDSATRKVVEANPAATELLGDSTRKLIGRNFLDIFDARSRRALEPLLASVGTSGRAADTSVRAASDEARALRLSAAVFREGAASYFLVRLLPSEVDAASGALLKRRARVLEIIENAPDAFVVTDGDGRIEFANRAFIELVQLAVDQQVEGELLDRWLGRPGIDFSLLAGQLREHDTLRMFATSLRGEYGLVVDVEICAVSVPDGDRRCFGFTLRDVSQRLPTERRNAQDRPRSVEQLTGLVGRVPLKELVRDSTDMIERLCIEAALELTGDNRASAAEILGLSRQSLYAKLHRHGLADIGDNGAE